MAVRLESSWQLAVEKASCGQRLAESEALALFSAPLALLGAAADGVCRRLHPGPIRTFVIDRNINYSNICVSGCRFCAFFRPPNHPEGYLLTVDEILEKVQEAVSLGATQILMQGGLHPDLPLDWFERAFRAIKARFHVTLHSLSPPEVVHLSRLSRLDVEETLRRLQASGLDSLPGGGAEILCEEVRGCLSPRKCTAQEWLNVMRAASRLGMRATGTMMFGHIETLEHRVKHLQRVRELQDETGVFTAFIPWTFVGRGLAGPEGRSWRSEQADLAIRTPAPHDYLRTLAISRLVLDNVANLQASWVTQGARIGQLALAFGANDLGSTMIEENVVRAAGAELRMSARDLADLIRRAGFTPARRDTQYHILEVLDDRSQ